jgi:hypothetical protein
MDRRAKKKDDQQVAVQHLKSVRNELNTNKRIADGNFRLLREIQASTKTTDHYSVNLFSVDAWDAALRGTINETIDSNLYQELQTIYTEARNVNEQVRRLRTEPLHHRVGEEEEYGPVEWDVWTISVSYWDAEENVLEEAGLGEVIKERCRSINMDISSVESDIDAEIDRLECVMEK